MAVILAITRKISNEAKFDLSRDKFAYATGVSNRVCVRRDTLVFKGKRN